MIMTEKQFRRGDIWIVDFNMISSLKNSSMQKGIRPAIISSTDDANWNSLTIQVIPLTTQDKRDIPVHVHVGFECGVYKDSIALVEQETTIDKNLLINKVGRCTFDVMEEIEKAIKIQKNLQDVPIFVLNFVQNFIKDARIIVKDEKIKSEIKNLLTSNLVRHCERNNISYVYNQDKKMAYM